MTGEMFVWYDILFKIPSYNSLLIFYGEDALHLTDLIHRTCCGLYHHERMTEDDLFKLLAICIGIDLLKTNKLITKDNELHGTTLTIRAVRHAYYGSIHLHIEEEDDEFREDAEYREIIVPKESDIESIKKLINSIKITDIRRKINTSDIYEKFYHESDDTSLLDLTILNPYRDYYKMAYEYEPIEKR